MNISTKSWHYRTINRFGTRTAKNKFNYGCHTTCTYIRALIWSMFMAVFFGVFIALLSALAITIISCTVFFPFSFLESNSYMDIFNKDSYYHFIAVFGIVGWGLISLTSFTFAIVAIGDWLKSRKPNAEVQAGLIRQAYADKVDGICTLVKLTD